MSNNVRKNKSIVMKRRGLGLGRQTPQQPPRDDSTKVNVGGSKTPTGPTQVGKQQESEKSSGPQRTVVKGRANTRCCVGGLLVVSGPYVGQFKPIYMGGNLVGRDEKCEVSLPNDAEISSKQVRIEYFSLANVYQLTRADGSQSTYVMDAEEDLNENKNWRPLSNAMELSFGDYVRLSPVTKVRFIAACDEVFAWAEPKAQPEEDRAYRNPSMEQ